jgi:hypothetical protein
LGATDDARAWRENAHDGREASRGLMTCLGSALAVWRAMGSRNARYCSRKEIWEQTTLASGWENGQLSEPSCDVGRAVTCA